MALYRYVKTPPKLLPPEPQMAPLVAAWTPGPTSVFLPSLRMPKIFPLVLMAVGILLMGAVATPIVYHELVVFPKLRRVAVISPVPETVTELKQLTQVAGVTTTTLPQLEAESTQQAVNTLVVDYTKASNWFPTAPIAQPNPSLITHYTIDIPKLKIKNAVVEIGGDDLKQTLVQYAETANPGEYGSPVIFGHSILRQFYNPSEDNPNRYLSIFSTIMTLDNGDEIYVNFDGIKYTFKVTDKYEVQPEQVEVLQQRYDRQGLKLITCVPEGTYLRRGVIEAQLVQTS